MHRANRSIVAMSLVLIATIMMTGCTRLWSMGVDGTGDRVQCADGTWSNSGGNSGACSWHDGVDGSNSDDRVEQTPAGEPAEDIEVPAGYSNMRSGLAFKWIDNANCNPTKNPYIVCWGVEVIALRACIPLPVKALITDGSGQLVDSIQGSLPVAMDAGDRDVVDLLIAVSRSDGEAEYFAEIQKLECL